MAHSFQLQANTAVGLVMGMLKSLQVEEGSLVDGQAFMSLDEERVIVLRKPDVIEIREFSYDSEGCGRLGAVLGCVKLTEAK